MRECIIGALVMLGVSLVLTAALLVYGGFVQLNNPSEYEIRGVDVSSYQGEIDWQELAANGIAFAYIKATEGSGYTDPCFERNAEQSALTSLETGAYHFFSYDSGGEEQAEYFLTALDGKGFTLPPVIDVEFYGSYESSPKSASEVKPQLAAMIERIREECGTDPIIYATEKSYELYSDCFCGCKLWIRNVLGKPAVKDWLFWQYSNRTVLSGYSGRERYVDMNVFKGGTEELEVL